MPAQANCMQPGMVAWTDAALAGWLMAACATPSSRLANAVVGVCQESRPFSSFPTRLASPASRTASMSTASEVSDLRSTTRPGSLALPSPSFMSLAHKGLGWCPACHLGSEHLPCNLCITSPTSSSVVCTSFCQLQSCFNPSVSAYWPAKVANTHSIP